MKVGGFFWLLVRHPNINKKKEKPEVKTFIVIASRARDALARKCKFAKPASIGSLLDGGHH